MRNFMLYIFEKGDKSER